MCRMHGGAAPQVRRKANERVARETALEQGRRLGGVVDVDPHEAILSALQEAAANVAVLRALVAGCEVDELPAGTLGMYEDERERLVKFCQARPRRQGAGAPRVGRPTAGPSAGGRVRSST